jgi:hypothetical protein
MRARRWFLPESPDLVGMLCTQAAITVEAMEALLSWSRGESAAAERVRALEKQADGSKRELRAALTEAFTTPLEPEDLFELSRGLDDILNSAKNTVREAEVMHAAPDAAMAEMAAQLAAGTRRLADAFAALARKDGTTATGAADDAVKTQRRVERAYRAAMSALIDVNDLREVAARRELYRRLARTGDDLAAVAERVWYSVLKES